jgi:hypothetical protein
MRFLALIILVLLILIRNANASKLECFTDEPQRYEFDLKDQKHGRYEYKIDYESGFRAGRTHHFVIKNVASLKSYDDYLTKSYTHRQPSYPVTYALRCKLLE